MTSGAPGHLGFEDLARRVQATGDPAELFGPESGGSESGGSESGGAVSVYRRMAAILHPDRAGPDRRAAATDAFAQLTRLWAQWRCPVTVPIEGRDLRLGRRGHRGDLAVLYPVSGGGPWSSSDGRDHLLLKVPRDHSNNDLLIREARALRRLADRGQRRHWAYVPRLCFTGVQRDPGSGVRRQVNLLGSAAGLHSLAEVGQVYPGGLDARDAAWIWRRLLVALGFAHRAGVIHGAVLPDHVLIQPEDHGVVLVDWCYAVLASDDRVPALVPRYRDWYPPEIPARSAVGPGTDLAMATRCMVELIGKRIPTALARFAAGCQLTSLASRPDDAWKVLEDLDQVLQRCFGPRRFRPFHLPAPAA